jgi:hypothetical protein
LNKKEENNLVCYSETVEFYKTLKKNIWFINRKVSGGRKLFLQHI